MNLAANNIRSDGVPVILDIMKSCRYLQSLDLGNNSICVDNAAVLVSGWQHESVLTLDLYRCFDNPHESALWQGEKCCSSCDHLLEQYYSNDYVIIELFFFIPKLLSRE